MSQRLAARQVARLFKWPIEKYLQDSSSRCTNCGIGQPSKELVYADRSGCDFFGFNNRGAHIAIEAKTNHKPSLPIWVTNGDGVKVHQMQHLREVSKAGGFGIIVWKRNLEFTMIDTRPLAPEWGKSFQCEDTRWHPMEEMADRFEEIFSA